MTYKKVKKKSVAAMAYSTSPVAEIATERMDINRMMGLSSTACKRLGMETALSLKKPWYKMTW